MYSIIPPENQLPPAADIAREKAVLRRSMIELREKQNIEQAACWSALMVKHLIQDLLTENQRLATLVQPDEPRFLGIYAAIRGEADLLAVINPARNLGWTPCFPRIVPAITDKPASLASTPATELIFIALPPDQGVEDFLKPGRFGLREPPIPLHNTDICQPQLIVLPGLAFDRAGHRLGWGKAYYDRYLLAQTGSRPAPRLLGAAFPFQVLPAIPVASHDQPVTALLTPDGLVPCGMESV